MAADSPMNFADFVAAFSTGDPAADLDRFRPTSWQTRFWSLVERGDPPKIVMVKGSRGLAR